MKANALKIVLLILAVFPIWLTIVALGEGFSSRIPSVLWKEKLNEKLLALADRRVQISEMLMTSENFDDAWLSEPMAVELPASRSQSVANIAIKFIDGEGRLKRLLRFPVKLYVQEEVLVALRNMARGSQIKTSDFKKEWRELPPSMKPVTASIDIQGRSLRNALQEGDVLADGALEKESLIQKGDRIRIAVIGRGISLTAVGMAQENGVKGQTIKVQNIDSKKEVLGTVVREKEVEVQL